MPERTGNNLAAVLFEELAACRKRGIDRLDVRSHNQQPVPAPELERLATEYAAGTRSPARGRIPQLKYLFRDAIAALQPENEMDAQLVSALFFGDSLSRVTKTAGELLDIAQRQFKYDSPIRFRGARRAAFTTFSEFLPSFVAAVGRPAAGDGMASVSAGAGDAGPLPQPQTHVDGAPAPEIERHIASTGYIDDGEHFVTLLSQAENITIVGYTNESLASTFRLALARKRAAMLRPDGCWSSVRVVFLRDDLLDRVNDERGFPDPGEARLLRRRMAVTGRRTVRIFLRSLPGRASWAIYDSPYFPPLIGTLFEMPGGQHIVQLVIRRPQRSGSDHLYLELDDTRGHYFSQVFNEIVDSAVDDNKLVPAGRMTGRERFQATTTRYRRNVLVDGSQIRDWLPMVLVITWQMHGGQAEPLLQLRTQQNATRELDRFTHLAGHIVQDRPTASLEFGLHDHLPLSTAAQRVQMETGGSDAGELTPLVTGRYFHPDKEHLFFFVYSCRLPDGLQLWPRAEMSALSVSELMSIRENQVLRQAVALFQDPPSRRPTRTAAFEIVAQNLILHDHPEMAARLVEAGAARAANFSAIAADVAGLEERTRQTWPAYEDDVEVVGLSGFQFREFFRTLLPFYRSVGVPGAAECLTLVQDDMTKRTAAARISVLYDDERVMESIPIEL